MLEKKEVMERLCKLTYDVMVKHFGARIPADCWCGQKPESFSGFQFNEDVIEFIEEAVLEAMRKKYA